MLQKNIKIAKPHRAAHLCWPPAAKKKCHDSIFYIICREEKKTYKYNTENASSSNRVVAATTTTWPTWARRDENIGGAIDFQPCLAGGIVLLVVCCTRAVRTTITTTRAWTNKRKRKFSFPIEENPAPCIHGKNQIYAPNKNGNEQKWILFNLLLLCWWNSRKM